MIMRFWGALTPLAAFHTWEMSIFELSTAFIQMMAGTFQPMTLSLSPKNTYVWMRLGGEQRVLVLIAPPAICAHCAEEKAWFDSYQGWFCYPCHQNLKHLGLLPYND